ncbi:MAG: DUF4249 domain-containing protein [Chitinophagaceae bacterium]|nr:DUF4249 domain-containing protein [Chitinophagaceae bacterium]MCW5927587.1 DUF4249 domain-containing protein [Chitinophagaceae bacterium]
MKIFDTAYIRILAVTSLLLLYSQSCKEEYPLPENLQNKNYLVVDGFIDNGNDITRIELSRTSPLDGTAGIIKESGASVWVESDNGHNFSLYETEPGVYIGGPFLLDESSMYRVNITTINGKSYSSRFEEVKKTPPIDNIHWEKEEDGVHIYVNTHDPENKSKYYSWQYEETWEFFSSYYSSFEYVNGGMRLRSNGEELFRCWQSYISRNIMIGSSSRLSEDIIYNAPITYIENNSWKLSSRYSILIKQRVLSKNAYEYLEKMKKSSESLGSIFDPMPTTDRGNVVCNSEPSEMVIGYVYVSTLQQQRIFISRGDVSPWWYNFICQVDTVPNIPNILQQYFGFGGAIPIDGIGMPAITDYTAASSFCMDCRHRGTSVKPVFWP